MKALEWKKFDEEDDPQRALLLDYLYDNLMFTVEKGFPWNAVCRCHELANEMLEESKGERKLT